MNDDRAFTDYSVTDITAATKHFGWEEFSLLDNGYATAIRIGGIFVSLVKVDSRRSTYDDFDNSLHVIFQVGSQLFRKTGWYNSYEDNEWESGLTEVVAKPQQNVIYEPRER